MRAEDFVRPLFRNFDSYSPVTPPDILAEEMGVSVEELVKLDGNENPYGCSPRVLEALGRCSLYHFYPDPLHRKLRKALREYVGLGEEYIVVGSGSDELIDLILRLCLSPGEKVLNFPPTFGMYSFSVRVCGGEVVEIQRREDFSLDLEAIRDAVRRERGVKMAFITSPNNPTGNLIPEEDIREILKLGILVVVDEAYYEFAGESVAHLVPRHENLIVLRTFSKWAGLAGLRIGYGIFPPKIAEAIYKMKLPYNINIAAQIAALESLSDLDLLRERVAAIVRERERLYIKLKEQGFLDPLPSRANFILCRAPSGKALLIKEELRRRRILVRYFNTPLLRDFIRISVGRAEHTDMLLEALEEIRGEMELKEQGR